MTPLIVGLTGGIGSGKSVVAQLLSIEGFRIYDSDREAKRIMQQNQKVIEAIRQLFGEDAYIDNRLNTPFIAQKAFPNPDLLNQLNAIVHPAVEEDILNFCGQTNDPVVIESAILFECNLVNLVNQTILVTAPIELRINRVVRRSGLSPEEIKHRIAAQTPDEERVGKASFVIVNDEKKSLIEQVGSIATQLRLSIH